MTTGRSSYRILVAIGVLLGVIVVVATIIAVQPPPTFAPDTPEGTAQGYFLAIDDGDIDAALAYLSDDLRDGCDPQDLRYWIRDVGERGIRVAILSTTVEGGTAEVDVTVTEYYGSGPFSGGSYEHAETLVMERSGDRWLIVESPWPVYSCNPEG